MDLLDIVYHFISVELSNNDYNRLINIIKEANKEYLFHESFIDVKDKLFEELTKSIKEAKGV